MLEDKTLDEEQVLNRLKVAEKAGLPERTARTFVHGAEIPANFNYEPGDTLEEFSFGSNDAVGFLGQFMVNWRSPQEIAKGDFHSEEEVSEFLQQAGFEMAEDEIYSDRGSESLDGRYIAEDELPSREVYMRGILSRETEMTDQELSSGLPEEVSTYPKKIGRELMDHDWSQHISGNVYRITSEDLEENRACQSIVEYLE